MKPHRKSVRAAFPVRFWVAAFFCTACVLSGATAAVAAGTGKLSDAQAAYQRDRAACVRGETSQDRATCLREASAALQESRRGRLDDGAAEFERNRLLRCERQPVEDREDCLRREKNKAQ